MKAIKNKKHRPSYHPVDVYQVTITIDCDVGNGYSNSIQRQLPLALCEGSKNVCRYGAVIDVGQVKIAPKWFKKIRMGKDGQRTEETIES